ncbi:MAG: hypothetical protein IK024_12740 [Treponema sp.]|nr:hypothetical protein [Treponema sp.]
MKIIISHDVDHLYFSDHLLKDLIIEKLWVRSFIHLLQKRITLKSFFYRIFYGKRMNHITEVMEYDKKHFIPSVFFFGMDNVLGMSYSQKKASSIIKMVLNNNFAVGVHGCNYQNLEKMQKEHDDFMNISDLKSFGIRNHYVRFDDETFEKMDKCCYKYDSTEFNKNELETKKPYKVGNMWEFPLHIMDGYICFPGKLQQGLESTFAAIEKAKEEGCPYCTILFHDYQFDEKRYPDEKKWYEKTIEYCEQSGYEFISYDDAIKELEA